MTARRSSIALWAAVAIGTSLLASPGFGQGGSARVIAWADVAPIAPRLEAAGLNASAFRAYVERTHRENLRRVREGDLDHLVFYLLQSTRLSGAEPIEPALSAKSLVLGLDAEAREAFLRGGQPAGLQAPPAVRARIGALLKAIERPGSDVRLQYFRSLVTTAFPNARQRDEQLTAEYFRVMRFVYEKEFVAQRAPSPAAAVADLYRSRGLSTDTAVEAGFVVQLGLGVIKGLQPDRRIRRVLILGPGLDLAPRTGFLEAPLESYQPWAVIDALVATGLSSLDDLIVTAADINPRVVQHLAAARRSPPVLSLVTGIPEAAGVAFSSDYREYFARLGSRISAATLEPPQSDAGKHLRKSVSVSAAAAAVLRAETLDIVTERLDAAPFDLAIATNMLPYFDDQQLALTTANIAAMLAPRGVFLHNELRPILGDFTTAFGLPFEQSRHAVIATVAGAARLGDSVFLHVKR